MVLGARTWLNTSPSAVNLLHFLFLLIKQAADSCWQSLGIAEECSVSKGSPGLFWAAARWDPILRWDIHRVLHVPARNSSGNSCWKCWFAPEGKENTRVCVQEDGRSQPSFWWQLLEDLCVVFNHSLSVCWCLMSADFAIHPSFPRLKCDLCPDPAWDSCKALPAHWGKFTNFCVPINELLFKLGLNMGDFCPVLVLHTTNNSCV